MTQYGSVKAKKLASDVKYLNLCEKSGGYPLHDRLKLTYHQFDLRIDHYNYRLLIITKRAQVESFAHTLCATPEDAEDALQETLWIMSRKIGSLRVTSAFISWLFTIVKHECYRLLRIRQKELPLEYCPRTTRRTRTK